jgi:hypothetical protein
MTEVRKRWMRRFVARYIAYLEVFGYIFVATVIAAVGVLFFVRVDDVSQAYSTPVIKPYEHAVTVKGDALVLSILVRHHQDVREGQPLAEICVEPAWVRRYQAAQHSDSLVAALDGTASRRTLTVDEEALRVSLHHASAQWKARLSGMPRVLLHAPHGGVVAVNEGLVGRVIPGKKEIVKVLDFDDLRIATDLRGANLAYARVGQPTKSEILMTYGNGEILRVDFDRSGQWRWTKRHGQYNSVADGKVADLIRGFLSGHAVTMEEDTLFAVTDVTEVDLQGILGARDAPAGEGIDSEPFGEVEVRGHVVEGEHTAKIRVLDLPDTLQARVRDALLERLQTKVLRSTDGVAFTVDDVRNLEITLTTVASDEKLTPPQLGAPPVTGEKVERKFIFETRLDDPPEALKAKVRELALTDDPTYIKTKTEVVVGQRRIAMLLFRKD